MMIYHICLVRTAGRLDKFGVSASQSDVCTLL